MSAGLRTCSPLSCACRSLDFTLQVYLRELHTGQCANLHHCLKLVSHPRATTTFRHQASLLMVCRKGDLTPSHLFPTIQHLETHSYLQSPHWLNQRDRDLALNLHVHSLWAGAQPAEMWVPSTCSGNLHRFSQTFRIPGPINIPLLTVLHTSLRAALTGVQALLFPTGREAGMFCD